MPGNRVEDLIHGKQEILKQYEQAGYPSMRQRLQKALVDSTTDGETELGSDQQFPKRLGCLALPLLLLGLNQKR